MRLARRLSIRILVVTILVVGAASAPPQPAAGAPMLVGYEEAARHGLERAWFAQVPVDPSRSRTSTWFLYFDRLYCVSDSGLVTAINAETGATLWTKQIGRPGLPAFGPDANQKYLGVVSGSRMYLLDRETGRVKWSRELGSAPSSGPALTADYGYVALVTGRIEGYKLDDPVAQPWYYPSRGRTYLRPTATGRVVSWPTSEGFLYVSRANEPEVLFRLETNADIVTSPAQMPPFLYIASLDGYLYAMHEETGLEQWRYSTGFPVNSSPAIVGEHAYVASLEPVLHCLDAKTGAKLWAAPGVSHFGAQGKQRVYASDRYGNLLVLDAKTGGLVSQLRTAEGLETLVNDQTDRIFLVNDRGLVQCLREIGAVEPTVYRKPAEVVAEEAAAAAAAAEAAPTDGAAGEAEQPPAPEDGALEGAGEAPADEAPADEPPADEPPGPEGDPDNPFDDVLGN